MNFKPVLAGFLFLGLGLFSAATARDDAAKKDLDKLQGSWQAVSLVNFGKSLPEKQVKALKLTIKGDKASHPGADGKTEEATIKLDPSRKPKSIDMTSLTGPDKGKTLKGIYSIEGNTLTICSARSGQDRPTELKAGKDVGFIVLKREK